MKLIIGTANFLNNYGFTNHHIIKKEIIEILGFASNNNVSGIDTSNSYDDFKKTLAFLETKTDGLTKHTGNFGHTITHEISEGFIQWLQKI